ncbi:MAG: dipeptidyl carboxypeptidase [Massilia sp.]|nr:dipeptidyl carboxypeptidase [Massilia sp.]
MSSIAFAAPISVPAEFNAANPFAKASSLPFEYPPFDKIHNEDFAPAYFEGMRIQAAEIAAIADNPKPATFDNTIVAMERSGQLLSRVASVFGNLSGANTNEALQALDRDLAPKLAAHSDAIRLNTKLYARIKSLVDKGAKLQLDAESAYLLKRYNTDFVRAGAPLSALDKDKLKAWNAELASLQTTFSQNVLKDANASALVVDTRAELAGMDDKAIATAAFEAKKRGLEGKFVIPVVNTTGQASLATLTDRGTRQRLLEASMARGSHGGEFDNRAIVLKLATLRAHARRCSATRATPPTCWKTRPRAAPPPSTRCDGHVPRVPRARGEDRAAAGAARADGGVNAVLRDWVPACARTTNAVVSAIGGNDGVWTVPGTPPPERAYIQLHRIGVYFPATTIKKYGLQ